MKLDAKKLQSKCDLFNAAHPVGTSVFVRLDGHEIRTKTSTKAEVLCGHSAVIWLDGVTRCYPLDRVRVA